MRFHTAVLWMVLCPALAGASEHTDDLPENAGTVAAEQGEQGTTDVRVSRDRRFQRPPLEEFVPSEEVSADKPVSFPTDI